MFQSGTLLLSLLLLATGCGLLPRYEPELIRQVGSSRERADRDWKEIHSEEWVKEPAFGCVTGRVASSGFLGRPLPRLEVSAYEEGRRAGVSHTAADGTFKFCVPRASRSLVEQVAEGVLRVLLGFVATPTLYRDRDVELRLEIRQSGYAPWSRSLTWNTGAHAHLDIELEPSR